MAAISPGIASHAACARHASVAANNCISKQAFAERFDEKAVHFTRDCLTAILQAKLPPVEALNRVKALERFERVIMGDSTTVALDPRLSTNFPGSRNQSGQDKAQLKVQALIDIKSARPLSYELNSFRDNDQKAAADVVPLLQPGDLLIRDLGYFSLKVFRQISDCSAWMVSRYKYGVKLMQPQDGEPIDLLRLLRRHGWVDMPVLVGAQERVPMRLVALPVSEQVAAKRRCELLQNRDKRYKPSKEHLALLSWTILLTTIPSPMATSEEVGRLYGLRWGGIEMAFKAWKSHFNFCNIHPQASAVQVEALVYARLIAITVFHVIVMPAIEEHILRITGRYVSPLKLAAFFVHDHDTIVRLARSQEGISLLMTIIYQHCTYEKRKRVPYPVKIIQWNQELDMSTKT
jgi:hypothetical protein